MKYTRQLGASLLVADRRTRRLSRRAETGPRHDSARRRYNAETRSCAREPRHRVATAAQGCPCERAVDQGVRRVAMSRVRPSATTRQANAPSTSAPGNTSGGSSEAAIGHHSGRLDAEHSFKFQGLHEHQRGRRSRHGHARRPGHGLERRDDSRWRHGQPHRDAAQAQRKHQRPSHHGVRGELGDVQRAHLPLDATVASAAVDRIRDEPKNKDLQKVGIGAVVGAIAGKLIGKSTKATVIGGAVGAAGGAATAAATGNYIGCVASGGSIVVKLNSAATVRIA